MTKRGGLGRGLAALIPTSAPVAEPAPDTEEATGESGAASSPPAVSLVPAPPSTFPFSSLGRGGSPRSPTASAETGEPPEAGERSSGRRSRPRSATSRAAST